jgi:Ca2+/Na+ antiporter
MVAMAFMHVHHMERTWWLEGEQKGAIIMIALTIGRFVAILFYGDIHQKVKVERRDALKFLLCAFCLIFAIVIVDANRDHYNALWFFMGFLLGIQDGILEHTSSQVGDGCEEEEKYRTKCGYFIMQVIAAFFLYMLSNVLWDKHPVTLLIPMMVSLLLGFIFSFMTKDSKSLSSSQDSAKMLILPDEEKKQVTPEKNEEKKVEEKKSEPVQEPPKKEEPVKPPEKVAEKAPVVAEVRLD